MDHLQFKAPWVYDGTQCEILCSCGGLDHRTVATFWPCKKSVHSVYIYLLEEICGVSLIKNFPAVKVELSPFLRTKFKYLRVFLHLNSLVKSQIRENFLGNSK